jgi:RimJ/RimL family protein N-acetyltransferase
MDKRRDHMVSLRNMTVSEIQNVLKWNDNGEAFLKQWSNFSYPLTTDQLESRINSDDYMVFSIDKDGKMVGTVQMFKFDWDNAAARIGCYLIDPQERGKGTGTDALTKLVHYAFDDLGLKKLELGVFDYNTGALKCYEKVGFVKVNEYMHPMGWAGYTMEIVR